MFYHISKSDHGETFEFIPKVPESALVKKEGNIPRVCVCSSLYYCLRAITSAKVLISRDIFAECRLDRKTGLLNPMTVYATEEEPYLPPNASDFRRNSEHWFIKPVVMNRIGYIDLNSLAEGKINLVDEKILVLKELFQGSNKEI